MNPTTDIALTWGEVFSAVGVALTLISLLGGIIFNLYRKSGQNAANLDAFKLEVAQKYVQSEHLQHMKEEIIRSETRTLTAIQGLTDRFDRFLTRQDER